MSVAVYIDGRPTERFEAYREILRRLGTLPDESNDLIEEWTTQTWSARSFVPVRLLV
jgi:hypothetical protein